jgi:hypothetical protein
MKNSYVSEDQFLNNQFTGVGGGWVVFMFTHEQLCGIFSSGWVSEPSP